MSNYRTSLGFARLSDAELDNFTENIIDSLTGNAGFPQPLVPLPALTAGLTAFRSAMSAAAQGGKQDTAAKNAARGVLENLLRSQAAYVQGVAGNDLSVLLSSGFEAVSNDKGAQITLPRPVVLALENEQSTKLALRLQRVPTARAYEVRMSYGTNGWQVVGIFTQARKIVLENLTPGTTYTVQARAIGGSTGSSDWSDPVSHMSL
jgi:hypothetical protein